jgi:glycerol-3-phosphate dehydrogenase
MKPRPAGEALDLIVVGGGIQGLLATLQAAARGLRVALLEADDFGHATSWNSLRIVHRGPAFLQPFDWQSWRIGVQQRAWFAEQFPDLTQPLPCLLPLYENGWRRGSALRWDLLVSDQLTRLSTRQLESERRLPPGRMLSARAARTTHPWVPAALAGTPLREAAVWYDLIISNPPRLHMELLHWAETQGAVAWNYVAADRLLVQHGRVHGVSAHDRLSGEQLTFRAPYVLNCCGPTSGWVSAWAQGDRGDSNIPQQWTLAFNLLLHRESGPRVGLVIARPGERLYRVLPRHERLVVGTRYLPAETARTTPTPQVAENQIADFLDELNQLRMFDRLTLYDVAQVHAGWVPAGVPGFATRLRRAWHVDFPTEAERCAGLVTLVGSDVTTARHAAESALKTLWPRRPAVATPPPHGSAGPIDLHSWRPPSATQRDAWIAALRTMVDAEYVTSWEDLLLRRVDWAQQIDDWRILHRAILEICDQAGQRIELPLTAEVTTETQFR